MASSTGFRSKYFGAVTCVGLSALAKTMTYMLLRYFVDSYFVEKRNHIRWCSLRQGFSFCRCSRVDQFPQRHPFVPYLEGVSGVCATMVRQYPTRSFTYHSKTQTVERDRNAALRCDEVAASLRSAITWAYHPAFFDQFLALINLNLKLALVRSASFPCPGGFDHLFKKSRLRTNPT